MKLKLSLFFERATMQFEGAGRGKRSSSASYCPYPRLFSRVEEVCMWCLVNLSFINANNYLLIQVVPSNDKSLTPIRDW